ncbi:MAG: NAD-dependent epimerase/dehydratase family protein [Chloroflexi bacterium]|nr:NAD-dependent epimerase/dehydratase family protein [Chloroflexota bacterium]
MEHYTILVTGGCGYLGSQLIRDLALDTETNAITIRVLDNLQSGRLQALMDLPEKGHYQFIEGDILDTSALRYALEGVDVVVHLAAIVSTAMGFGHDPIWVEQVNHWGTARLVESCLEAGVQRFIFASSAAVYGPGGPFHEEDLCHPIGPYAQSKYRAEENIRVANERGLAGTVLRLGTFFGYAPGVRVAAVANRFAYLAGVGKPLTVYGDGRQRRPVVHVRDASSAIRFCLKHEDLTVGRILNVVGKNVSVLDLGEAVRYSKPDVQVRYTDQDALTHFSFELEGAAFAQLGWRPLFSIESGLAELLGRLRNLGPLTAGHNLLEEDV